MRRFRKWLSRVRDFRGPIRITLGPFPPRPMQNWTGLHFTGDDATVPRIVVECYGRSDPLFTVQVAGGSGWKPEPVGKGRLLGGYIFRGFDGSPGVDPLRDRHGFAPASAGLRARTTEVFGPNNHGTEVLLSVTPKGGGPANGDQDVVSQIWRDDGSIQFRLYGPGNAVFGHKGIIEASPHARPTTGFLGLGPMAHHVIQDGEVVITGSRVRLDTNRGPGELWSLWAEAKDGDLAVVQIKSPARPVTLKARTSERGNLDLPADAILTVPAERLALIYDGYAGVWTRLG